MSVANFRALQAFEAGADLTRAYGLAAVLNATGKAVLATTANGPVMGIIHEPAPAGGVIGIITEQGVKAPVVTGGAIAAGAKVAVNNAGKFVAHSTGTAVGVATQAAAAADAIITIVFYPAGVSA